MRAAIIVSLLLLTVAGSAGAETMPAASTGGGPSTGALRAVSPDGTVLGNCPLEHTDVEIEVSGFVARTRVTHRFTNPFPQERIEAVYTFPLPEDAAVRDMEMRVGERLVKADIRRRAEAQQEYEAARESGETASLLDQERPNIFTSSVANIRPGIPVIVTLEYVEPLDYEDGHYELAFPMTVGPRFIPGAATGHEGTGWAPDTDRVPDASRITPPVAPPGRSGHDIALTVHLDAGVAMGDPTSPSHDVAVTRHGPGRAMIRLSTADSIPNRDFILRWDVSPARVGTAILTHRPDATAGGYVTLMLQPNAAPPVEDITPKEIVFVVDTSGSMYGRPLELSKALMRRLLADLNPRDTFTVLRYNDSASGLSPAPLANTAANVARALSFVEGLEGEGGTDALGGVRAAFAFPHDEARLRVVVFMTDGYIGNESEILAEIQTRIGPARLFSFGVGSSVNRYLLEEMAIEGRGHAAIVTEGHDPDDAVDGFYRRLRSPYLTDIAIDWGGLAVDQVYPARVPDLFAGQPLQVHGRYAQPGTGTVTVRGRLAGRPFEQAVEVTLPGREDRNGAIASIWARRRISELSRTMHTAESPQVVEDITQVALDHRLMSQYTSFVAVEHRVIEEGEAGGPPRTVPVPVELPEGVSAERIFGGSSLSLARFMPGDPELRVEAPADARAITAVFPFGETLELEYEPRLGLWTCRFLVPRGTPEGNYFIDIIITAADGSQERIRQGYTVDASAPDLDVRVVGQARRGERVYVEAQQRFTAADRALHGRRRRVEILSDLARLRLEQPDGTAIALERVEPGLWRGTWQVPEDAPASVSLRATAFDMAGNRGVRTVAIDIAE
jgi:Ca-activated chloride channel family protein